MSETKEKKLVSNLREGASPDNLERVKNSFGYKTGGFIGTGVLVIVVLLILSGIALSARLLTTEVIKYIEIFK